MKAVCWNGTGDIRVQSVPDPKIQYSRDIIVRITASGICGSDLQLMDGFMPTMEKGDILGHEPMGIVTEVGPSITNLRPGAEKNATAFVDAISQHRNWERERGTLSPE